MYSYDIGLNPAYENSLELMDAAGAAKMLAFDPARGTFKSPVVVFQERCWSVSPAADLDAQKARRRAAGWLT